MSNDLQGGLAMLQPGTVLSDRFELIRQLGDGALGSVWLVRDRVLDDTLVAKLVAPSLSSRPEVLALLKQECRLARRLHHPGIVRVHDFHDDGSHAFITMAYVPGNALSDWRGRPWTECLPILTDLADALSYAHTEGVVHRDLKPANVQVDAAGRAHLMDFGVAGALGSGTGPDDRVYAFPGGSPASMSPQQLAGEPPHPADDVYGFGALVYELVCGVPPLAAPLDAERIRNEVPAPMQAPVAPPQVLVELVAQMLSKLPGDRPASMAAIRSRLVGLSADIDNRTVPPDVIAAAPPHTPNPVAPRSPAPPAPPAAIEGRRFGVVGMLTALMFLLMVGIGVGVFVYLPDWIDLRASADRVAVRTEPRQAVTPESDAPSQPPAATTVLPPEPAPPDAADGAKVASSSSGEPQSAALKAAAEAALSDFVTRRDELLEQGVEIWAAEDFATATEVAERADRAWLNRDYATARDAYQQADAALGRVAETIPEVLNGLLSSGEQALVAQDEATALRDFSLALRIEPVNGAAQRGLKRAEALPEVRRLMQAGQALETRSELPEALDLYRQALVVDAESIAAGVAVERVSAVIEDRAFRAAMTQGLDALDRGDLGAAAKAFERGRDLRPGAPEVQDGLQRVAARRRAIRIRALRTKAERLEAGGDWSAAAAEYSAMLAIDPGLVTARQGAERNQRKARIAADLDGLLADPRALYPDRAQAKAEALIAEVTGLSASPPRFDEQARQLEARLRLVRTPVPVRIESDSETEVVIYRVGSLGRFAQRQVALRPGVYTVLGTRRGYRDVRRTLTVDPGQGPAALVLRCEERV